MENCLSWVSCKVTVLWCHVGVLGGSLGRRKASGGKMPSMMKSGYQGWVVLDSDSKVLHLKLGWRVLKLKC